MKVMRAPKVFVDEKSAKILLAALNRPLTALEICKITGVPVAHVFSRLRIMERKGLVAKVSYRYDARGRERAVYRSMLYDSLVFVDRGRLKATFQLVAADQQNFSEAGEALL